MYNNSPRFGIKNPTSTPAEVGPFTYILDDCFEIERVNVVPFGSSSERKSTFVYPKFTDALYNVRTEDNIVGGHSLKNRAKRFIYKHSDVPPPGTYDPKLPGKRKQYSLPPPGKGKIYLCRIPYSSLGSAPSIPTKRDAYGYEVDDSGKIIKNIVPTRKNEAGPGSYFVKSSSCANDNPYSGCHWSRRTSIRNLYKVIEGPGPAAYDIGKVSKCRRNEVEEEYREMARRFSYLPRYLEQQMVKANRQNYPSPADYETQDSSFTYKPPVTTVVRPFIVRKPRFEVKQSDGALHAIYDTITPMGHKVSPSIKQIPFTFLAERFKRRRESCSGTGLFMPKGFAEELSHSNSRYNYHYKAPFNSTVPRKTSLVPPDACFKPDCAVYPREEISSAYQIDRGHSIFLSTTERGDSRVNVAPPATRYSVAECFNKSRNKISHNVKKLPFLGTSERKTVILAHKDEPGPADYVGQGKLKEKGYFFDRTVRFKDEKKGVPPPDHYYIHPLYGESMYAAKNSFNLKIAESILQERLRLPPEDTFADYIKTLKAKKKLRCYASILDE